MTERLNHETISRVCGDERYDVRVVESLPSTNATVRSLAEVFAPEGLVLFAEGQTEGRGRLGRSFFSPVGSGLYFSLLLRPRFSPKSAASVTTFAAVAVARAIERVTGCSPAIKWVNDVWIGPKKVCGILAESALDASGEAFSYLVLGIGINVKETAFPEELREIATSLERECGGAVDRNRLAGEVLRELSPLLGGAAPDGHMDEYRRRNLVIGRDVTVVSGSRSFHATVTGIADDGTLTAVREDGTVESITAGEVSLRV